MNKETLERLEKAGFVKTTAAEFVGLTEEQLDSFEDRVMADATPEQDFDGELDESLFTAKMQWHPVDLMDSYPGKFESIEDASKWLKDNESYIQEAMYVAGMNAIEAII